MPRKVHVPDDATPFLVKQAYEAGSAYQWVREAWRNSYESGATRIVFGVEERAAARSGVLRRTIIDNGAGMSAEELPLFLTTFGGGGKPISSSENFGQGFKSSVLPWNPYGVVVISYSEPGGEGAMIWLHRDTSTGNYTLKEWDIDDGTLVDVVVPFDDPDTGIDWRDLRPPWVDTGTVMVLLGDSAESSTINGDPDPFRRESAGGLLKYLNERLLTVVARSGDGLVDTTVVDLENVKERGNRGTKDNVLVTASGAEFAIHQRKVRGLEGFIPDTAVRGEVTVDDHGTVVSWYFVPEGSAPVSGSADYVNQSPPVVIDYQGEGYHADRTHNRFRQFGVTDEIRGRTWLIVRPPVYSDSSPNTWGVITQASRSLLFGKGGTELPWDQWGERFFAQFPKELSEARDAARAASPATPDAQMAKTLSRVLDRLNPRFKASRLVASKAGRLAGNPNDSSAGRPRAAGGGQEGVGGTPGGAGGTDGPKTVLTQTAQGAVSGALKDLRVGFPAYRWSRFTDDEIFTIARFDPHDQLALEDGSKSTGVVHLNTGHPLFVTEFRYWADEVWPRASSDQVAELLKRIYGEEAVAHVVHALQLNGSIVGTDENGVPIKIGKGEVDALLTPAALSASMLGLVNVEQRVLTQGGGRFGSRSNS